MVYTNTKNAVKRGAGSQFPSAPSSSWRAVCFPAPIPRERGRTSDSRAPRRASPRRLRTTLGSLDHPPMELGSVRRWPEARRDSPRLKTGKLRKGLMQFVAGTIGKPSATSLSFPSCLLSSVWTGKTLYVRSRLSWCKPRAKLYRTSVRMFCSISQRYENTQRELIPTATTTICVNFPRGALVHPTFGHPDCFRSSNQRRTSTLKRTGKVSLKTGNKAGKVGTPL